jgi:hypothetical protein
MKNQFLPITLCLVLFSMPMHVRAIEDSECVCIAASWLPSLAFIALTGATFYAGTYLGLKDTLEEPEIANRIMCLEARTKVHHKWNVNLAAIVPNATDGRDIVSDFGKTLTLDEQQWFLQHGSNNAISMARKRLTRT